MTAPTLIFGWGNPSRGDDALGPRFVEAMQALAARHPEWGEIDFLTDFQLQVEHALDLHGRTRVLFVDAHVGLTEPYALAALSARRDATFSSHMLSPHALLQVWADIEDEPSPPCFLLSLRAEQLELGAPLSACAQTSLHAGLACAAQWLDAG